MIKITIKQKIGLILFGIFLTLVFLEIGLRVGGFVLLSIQKNKNKVIESGDNIYRILCLGESTTANLYNGQSSWPSELENILNKGYKIKFKMFNVGITATDTTRILNQLEDDLDTYEPHMVITMMGINDLLYNNTHPHFQFQKRISNRILFFENFRVYKLFKLLWLHSNAKIKELKFKQISHINLDDKHILKFEGNVKNLMNDQNYLELAVFYQNRKMFEEAEEMFKRAIEINPKNEWIYIRFAETYQFTETFEEAEEMFKRAIEINPESYNAYLGLARYYSTIGSYKQEEMLKKSIKLTPNNTYTYHSQPFYMLGDYYFKNGNLKGSIDMFKKAIEIYPGNVDAYDYLLNCYKNNKNISEGEEFFKKNMEMYPNYYITYYELGLFYQNLGRFKEAEEMFKKSDEIKIKYYKPETQENYRKLYQKLKEKEIKLVVMQYPTRDINEFKMMFEGDENIIFVSNENNFKEALKTYEYENLFIDHFAGDFGHCTKKGNILIAENVANIILKYFKIN